MENLIEKVPYSGAIISIVIIVLGTAAGLYMLDAYRDKKKKGQDATDDRLIVLLQTTVNELEKKVNKQSTDIVDLTKKVTALERENETLIKVLQGRDEETQKFYKEGFAAMGKTNEIHDSMKELIEAVSDLGDSIKENNTMTSSFVETIRAHFLNVEKVAISK